MTRLRRPLALAGIGTALLCNYWLLEHLAAPRVDIERSWISDLAARSEAGNWRFIALAILAGLALALFAWLLLPRFGALSPSLRAGVLALGLSGLLGIIAGAAPLSCAEGLQPQCTLSHDALDAIHSTASIAEVLATGLAFALVGWGLLRLTPPRPEGWSTLILAGPWLAFALLTGISLALADVDAVKGIFQRADQVLLGVWLVLLGAWAERLPPSRCTGRINRSGLVGKSKC